MARTRVIEHGGKEVVLLDFTGMRDEGEVLAEIGRAREYFAGRQPDASALTCTDATDSRYTAAVVTALKELATHNRPYVKAGAAVSPSPALRVLSTSVAILTGRRIPVFKTREEALDWLVSQ